jgi:hypothetical protein
VCPGPGLDRGVFCDLTTALEAWIELWNEGARPFTKTADQLLDGICRCCSRIFEPAH